MNILKTLGGSAALLSGIGLFAWVGYDATEVMQVIGLENQMDEAAVVLLTLLLGTSLTLLGLYSWVRGRESAAAGAA